MKTPKDPRHIKRQEIIKSLYAESFHKQPGQSEIVSAILSNVEAINAKITEIAPEFPVEKINKVDLAILQLGVYELTISRDAPEKVIIDEAIELAKEFGSDNSAPFVNGALGKLSKELNEQHS